ncbi:MAG: hypothetical protein HC889_19755 [Synechococcaceae cyanobacterium SM1_2_3]|nr:hypothetical protein [Synechococcaceae cyanobacterium SM1_2_3]
MNAFPEYDHAVETVLHCRCTVCHHWWHLDNAPADRSYWCPHCGKQLAPAQYSEDNAAPRLNHKTGAIDL